MAVRVRRCNCGQEAGRPRLVDSVEKGRSRSKLRAGPERDGSFRELQAATAGTGIGRSVARLRRFLAVAARRNSSRAPFGPRARRDRKSVVEGKRLSVVVARDGVRPTKIKRPTCQSY